MRIVLPGALPDPAEARELIPYLQQAAPTLAGWMERARAQIVRAEPAKTGCTPYEFWQLRSHDFKPEAGQNFATGLAPLKASALQNASISPSDVVWLVELVHVSPSRDGAALVPASELSITAEQSVALFESVHESFESAGFRLHRLCEESWRIELPAGFRPASASPALVSRSAVNDWWPQDLDARPWRKLVNEVQMLWHDHPVNQARFRESLLPVNSLWLYGGGRTQQLHFGHATEEVRVHHGLATPAAARDWGGWLAALAELEAGVFHPLGRHEQPDLVLIGSDRLVELQTGGWHSLKQWFPGSRKAWRDWWSPPN